MIGEGSVGMVYRARQESVGRDVAIKVLKRRYQKHESITRRFAPIMSARMPDSGMNTAVAMR